MLLSLERHADTPCQAISTIDTTAIRTDDATLVLRYSLAGAIDDLALPPREMPARADELWRHSCFEAFVRVPPDPAYREFNFAPSTRWAAYRFDDYRAGMTATDDGPTRIMTREATDRFTLFATLDLSDLPHDEPWKLALSAVIEDRYGQLSYWALVHPPGKPDFHHPDSFTLSLTGPET